jgi:hypothetical protein
VGRGARWATALLIGTAAVVLFACAFYPDQVLSAYLQTRRWAAAAGPIAKLPAQGSVPSNAMRASDGQPLTRFVILPAGAGMRIANGGTWRPTKADIDGLEANLKQVSSLKAETSVHTAIDHPEQYFRQYLPIIREGEKLIYINAFCDQFPESRWRQRLVVIFDGGSCFWQALYDPIASKFSHLRINGEA